MTVETFFANFGHLADVPNGVQKLRELILQLAVQGKLVPQDPKDEPASVLLERVDSEKEKLIAAKEIRAKKDVAIDAAPYELPKSWSWVPIGNICRDWGQKVPDKQFSYIDVSAIDNEKGVVAEPAVTEAADAPSRARKLVQPGTVIYSTVRPYLLNIAVIDKEFDPEPIASTAFAIVHPLGGISSQYIFWFLRSPVFIGYVESKMLGVAYPAINDSQFFSGLFPLPPLEEQKRIVAKVDQLMALCDELEARQQKQQQGRVRLNNAALDALLTAREPIEFADHWQRINSNFDLLYDHPETIAKLRAAILQLAVQGKLVPQDPNDEPASVLLERIAKERELLVKQKKIKSAKPPVDFQGLDELKKKLPTNWSWVRLSEIADVVRGGSPRPAGDPRFYNGEIPFLKVADVSRAPGKMVVGFNASIKKAGLNKTRFIDRRTVLFTNSGATLGIPAICDFPATFNDGIAAFVELSAFVFDEYLYLYLKALSQWFMEVASRGQGQPNLNTDIIKSTWFPLPSLAEQKRIVAKVDQLMALCDELEAKLNQAQQHSEKLMGATIRQLLVA
ncbi:MAG: restriction endonuclease subunit S [Desulfuromonadales bacterium]